MYSQSNLINELTISEKEVIGLINRGLTPQALCLLLKLQRAGEDLSEAMLNLLDELKNLSPIPLAILDQLGEQSKVLRVGGAVRWIDPFLAIASSRVFSIDSEAERFGEVLSIDKINDFHNVADLGEDTFDWVVSSHVIEHLENPLRALIGCKDILKDGGFIYSVIPRYDQTFDRLRAVTSLSHLIDDYENRTSGVDWLHVEEFLRNYDCDADLVFKGDWTKFFSNYKLKPGRHTHYHVFDPALVFSMHGYVGFDCINMTSQGNSIHYIGRKIS